MTTPAEHRGILRRIAPEAALLLGAGRAILLQLADPRIGIAVVRHSDFVANPMARLHNTLAYVYALSVGDEHHRAAVVSFVNAAHAPVHAPRDEARRTPAYSARDPRLQLWVAATLYDSAAVAGAATLPPLDEAQQEQLYREYACLGEALQMPADFWPADRAGFQAYFRDQVGRLELGDEVRRAAAELFIGRHAPWWVRLLLPWVRDVTIVLLPATVRELYGYRLTARVRRRAALVTTLVRWASRVLPAAIRQAPMRYALRRIERGLG
ncbi:oxygenase MpaB family protein [Glutamicibacter creatinolyticus]|uniref:oxygenase MpaB family protein n=1 Tax=Glutamicibacter creatinolyticus TaxID=162496 RepID=UPI0037BECE77